MENGGSGKIAVSATGRGCSATGRPVPEKWGKMGKMKERERETREDFGDLWCLWLVNHENGKVKNIYVGIKG